MMGRLHILRMVRNGALIDSGMLKMKQKVADLIHHELVKESETIESTSEVIESVPSTSNNKADIYGGGYIFKYKYFVFRKKQVYLLK